MITVVPGRKPASGVVLATGSPALFGQVPEPRIGVTSSDSITARYSLEDYALESVNEDAGATGFSLNVGGET